MDITGGIVLVENVSLNFKTVLPKGIYILDIQNEGENRQIEKILVP